MDFSIWLAYILCFVATIISVVYGIVNWNKGADSVEEEDVKWAQEEKKIEHEFE